MSIKLEEGKFYKTRDGRKVGPMTQTSERVMAGYLDANKEWYFFDGRRNGAIETPIDLLSEWPASPVVIETVKRIVPGTYGVLRIDLSLVKSEKDKVLIDFWNASPTKTELQAAIATLTEIAEAL